MKSYIIDKDSSFLDIGHGFGKVVLFMAANTTMHCHGIEVTPFRADQSFNVLTELRKEYSENKIIPQVLNRVHYFRGDAAKLKELDFDGRKITHVYSLNCVFNEENKKEVCKTILRSP